MELNEIKELLSRVSFQLFGNKFWIEAERDKLKANGRVYLQVVYEAPDVKDGTLKVYKGRKWYLSPFMIPDEIIKTAYVAFEMAVKHEVLEGFFVDGVAIFNPHRSFEDLIALGDKEVKRD